MRNTDLGPLKSGSEVAVIGGGPGGVAAAICLKQKIQALGGNINVTIIEGKQFQSEQHHNQCVGVLSPPIQHIFEQNLKIPFPHHLVQSTIQGYVLHTRRREIVLDGESDPSYVFRRVKFDAYMLSAAQKYGVEILSARATGVEFHSDRVVVYTESKPVEANVVVGAFGLDEGTGVIFHHAVGYRPPPALSSIVTKYHPGPQALEAFGKRIHAFLPASDQIEFGGITPKANHLTLNIAGVRVNSEMMDLYLRIPEVRRLLPCQDLAWAEDGDLKYHRGTFPCGLAHNFTGDRYVMVGDASGLVRAFKGKGVTSAIQTGLRAAETMIHSGISKQAFKAYHLANRDITDDLPYGMAMRWLTVWASKMGLMDIVLSASAHDEGLRQALFEAVSAHQPYKAVVRKVRTWGAVMAILRAMTKAK